MHLKRLTDETMGLILSVVVLFALVEKHDTLAVFSSGLLVLFFLFRLSWGKAPIHKLQKKRKR